MEPIENLQEHGRRANRRVLAPDVEQDVACAAAAQCPVLISGSADLTEWLARMIHARSDRKDDPFIVFCVDSPVDELRRLELLLNGGGPDRGTLFVSDVSRAGRDLQGRLARLVDAQAGAPEPRLRLIAATSAPLYAQVESGSFDDVLFYRLNKIHVQAGSGPRGRGDRLSRHDAERFKQSLRHGPGNAGPDWQPVDRHDGGHLARRAGDEHFIGATKVFLGENGL